MCRGDRRRRRRSVSKTLAAQLAASPRSQLQKNVTLDSRWTMESEAAMALPPAQIVRQLLTDSPGEALCDACLAFVCRTSLTEMRQITCVLAAEDSTIRRGATCTSCGRTVASILYRGPMPKCIHCSRPLIEGEAGVTIEGDQFHDACLRRLITDDRIRVSRALNRQSRALIERSRKRIREGGTWPDLDEASA